MNNMSEFGDFDVDDAVITDEHLKVTAITGGCARCNLSKTCCYRVHA